ncbi:MAG TPA: glycosyltransferase family 2 protein [Opitutaceae bacterium]|nr:glycosyltransferase family 2 protein [Opitutaceae bacterium]
MSADPIPILSVIIVAYQSRYELPACLGSLPRELLGRVVEVVVVDNSRNADGTVDWVRGEFPWVDCVSPEANLGFGRANNLGFRRTTGECVLFLNPDTVVNAMALAHCLRRVRDEPGIGLITPRLELADGSMDLACRRSVPSVWDGFCRATGLATAFPGTALFSGYNLTHLPTGGTYDVGMINGAFMLGRRDMLTAVAEPGGAVFDERFFMYGDDIDLCIRVGRAGHRIVYDGRVCITHLKGVSVAKEFEAMSAAIFDANRDVYLKHFGATWLSRWKWRSTFGAWKHLARFRAALSASRRVRPQ